MKNGDVVIIADVVDDDKVRTSGSQDRATAILCTEEFFFRAQYTLLSPHISTIVRGQSTRHI
jgi:hypothetical protein